MHRGRRICFASGLLLLALAPAAAAEPILDPLAPTFHAGLAIGPTGTAYLGVTGGPIALRDG